MVMLFFDNKSVSLNKIFSGDKCQLDIFSDYAGKIIQGDYYGCEKTG
jgi:hypothetical protein